MPGALPGSGPESAGAHLEVAVLAIDAAHVLLDLLPDRPALRMPEHEPRRLLLHVEEIELRAEPPVVALLRLLEHLEIRVLVFLLRPGGAVDALEHLVAGVAAPVRPRDAHQLDNFLTVDGVRPAAEVDPVALP